MIEIDPIILGDNQFFGVNHMSQDKGRASYEKFKNLDEIKKTIYFALENGVKGLFFSTHPSRSSCRRRCRRTARRSAWP